VWSILLYAFSACAASFALTLPQLLFFRCTTVIGVCVEYIAGAAWVAELFPIPKQRESVLGYTQAAFGLGGLMVTGAYYVAVTYAERFPAIHGSHEAWRYTLLSGLMPAIPLILARPFLPESPIWQDKESKGTLKRPSFAELFRPALRNTTLVTTFLVACSYALASGVILQTTRMVPGLPEVRNFAPRVVEQTVSGVQLFQELGTIAGRLLFAFLVVRIATQRRLLRLFLVPGLIVFSCLYFFLRDAQFTARQVRGFSRGSPVERAVQPLGQLFAANVPDALARHRRGFRNQHRSPGDRCIGRAFHDTTRQHHARCQYGRSPCILGRHACRPRIHWFANREFLAA
jgi:MFS family permease